MTTQANFIRLQSEIKTIYANVRSVANPNAKRNIWVNFDVTKYMTQESVMMLSAFALAMGVSVSKAKFFIENGTWEQVSTIIN